MNLTPMQLEVVTARGRDLLVSASAGSGKTEVLAWRCVELVSDPRVECHIDELLVVTFTRAAAAEMRHRIARLLTERLERAVDDSQRAHLLRQRLRLDGAEISTIDKWCARLVREHYAAAGIDSAFRVLEAADGELLRRQTLDELLRDIYTVDLPLMRAAREWLGRRAHAGDDFLCQWVRSVAAYEEQLVDPRAWRARWLTEYSRAPDEQRAVAEAWLADAVRAELMFQAKQLEGVIARAPSDTERSALHDYRTRLGEWSALLETRRALTRVMSEIHDYSFPKSKGELTEEVKRWWDKRLRKSGQPEEFEQWIADAPQTQSLARITLELADEFRCRLDLAKRRESALEFNDVLRAVHELMIERDSSGTPRPSPLAQSLQRRYRWVLVDEFQDTSPLQVDLIERVTRAAGGFYVGDVKQSIYAFRQAEPRLFVARAAAYEAGDRTGSVLALSENFRSHARVLEPLNGLFAGLFDPALGGVRYDERQALEARRTELPNPTLDARPRVTLHVLPGAAEQEDEQKSPGDEIPLERIEREGLVAAREIRALLDAGTQILERGPDGQPALRPLRLSDIVVLLRAARQNAPRLAAQLRHCGVPAVALGRESLLDSIEAQDVIAALRLVVNRRQDLPLLAYLRGPLVELREAQLAVIRESAPRLTFWLATQHYAEAGADSELRDCVAAALRRLDKWSELARWSPATAVVRRILRDGELIARAKGLFGADHRVAMMHALEELARQCDGGQGSSADFITEIDAMEAAESVPPGSATTSADAVRVMTIHASKGLEFPVVFLMNAGAGFRAPYGKLIHDERLGLAIQFDDYPAMKTFQSPLFSVLRAEQKQRNSEEELRLLYVALTRARERVFVIGVADQKQQDKWRSQAGELSLISRYEAKSFLEWLVRATFAGSLNTAQGATHPPLEIQWEEAPEAPPLRRSVSAPVDELTGEHSLPPRPEVVEQIIARVRATPDLRWAQQPAVVSVTQAKTQPGTPTSAARQLQSLAVPRFARADQDVDGRQRGVAVHRFLMNSDLRALWSPLALQAEIDRTVASGLLSDEDEALLSIEDLTWFGATPLGRILGEHTDDCRRELPFVYMARVRSAEEQVMVRGVIDCLFDTPAGIHLVDYKTDRMRDDEERAERRAAYTRQLQLYAGAAAALFDRPVAGATLIFLRERTILSVPVESPILARVWHDLGLEFPGGIAPC